jgi:hypothetical protein
MSRVTKLATIGFVVGAIIPAFWGTLSFLLFNVPEGSFSRAYWSVVYTTCPFWYIDGEKAMFLMPLLNGCLYGTIVVCIAKAIDLIRLAKNPL